MNISTKLKGVAISMLMLASLENIAQVRLNPIFADHMVLQQKAKIKVWGKSAASENLELQASFLDKPLKTQANSKGLWIIELKTPAYGGPHSMAVKGGNNVVKISDIYLGEVWLASGQSNMEFPLDSILRGYNGPDNYKDEVKNANFPLIRQYLVADKFSNQEEDVESGQWLICKPENAKKYSAVAYFFARNLQQELDVPVGIINAAWGGTFITSWMRAKELQNFEEEAAKVNRIQDDTVKLHFNYPSVLYNAMIHPISNYTVKGLIWNQGEKNVSAPHDYAKRMENLISGWRSAFQSPAMPFLFVQIAPYNYMANFGKTFFGDQTSLGYLVEQQLNAEKDISNAFMARTGDVSNGRHIHYRNKQDVGNRLALLALKEVYKKDKGLVNGPDLANVEFKDAQVMVTFKNVGDGLKTNGTGIKSFELSTDGDIFYPAEAFISGKDKVIVSSSKVTEPTMVRYCFKNTDTVNLWNSNGFPAVAFRAKR
jgi:sialate O-acetylesterase